MKFSPHKNMQIQSKKMLENRKEDGECLAILNACWNI